MAIFSLKKFIVSIMIVILLLNTGETRVCGSELKEKSLYASSCAVTDGYNGRVLYGKKSKEPLSNASTTKILTCILVLENGGVKKWTEASENAIKQPQVKLGVRKGVKYKVLDLLYCMMLESYNDCAVVLAEATAGSVEKMAKNMNEKAEQIGCKETYFITPNGLDEENSKGYHHTTAEDLCQIMKYCCWDSPKSGEFLKIVQTLSYSFMDSSGKKYICNNHNQLLLTKKGVIAGKTGYTSKAGYCYVMAYEKQGKRFCVALLGCGWPNNKDYKWKDCEKIIKYCEMKYKVKRFVLDEKGFVKLGKNVHGELIDWQMWQKSHEYEYKSKKSLKKLFYMSSSKEHIVVKKKFKENIKFPIKKNSSVGNISIRLENKTIGSGSIFLNEKIQPWNLSDIFILVLCEFY